MDLFEEAGVNVVHSVIVTGVTNTQAEKEIIYHLHSYGEIKTLFIVTERESPFYKNLAVEFINAAAVAQLKPHLPYTYTSRLAADVEFVVTLLSDSAATATVGTP